MKIYRVDYYYEDPNESPGYQVRCFSTLEKAYEAYLDKIENIKDNFSEELSEEDTQVEENVDTCFYSLWCEDYSHFEKVGIGKEELDKDSFCHIKKEEIEHVQKMKESQELGKTIVTWPGEEI